MKSANGPCLRMAPQEYTFWAEEPRMGSIESSGYCLNEESSTVRSLLRMKQTDRSVQNNGSCLRRLGDAGLQRCWFQLSALNKSAGAHSKQESAIIIAQIDFVSLLACLGLEQKQQRKPCIPFITVQLEKKARFKGDDVSLSHSRSDIESSTSSRSGKGLFSSIILVTLRVIIWACGQELPCSFEKNCVPEAEITRKMMLSVPAHSIQARTKMRWWS
ncbi:hypothetical protein BDV12DRAFT_54674 [Aspergillus spectabilis]